MDPLTIGAIISGGAAIMSSQSASKDQKAAEKAAAAELQFAQEQYNDWNAVYGPIQDNLSNYYMNLSPETFEAAGIENYQQEFQKSLQTMEQNLVQQGIDPRSGVYQSLKGQAELEAAEDKARIRRDAPQEVANMQSNFLQIGMGQNPADNVQNTLANRASYLQNQATASGQQAGIDIASAIKTGLSAYEQD